MDAQELRIGNLLLHEGETVVIDSIQQSLLSVKGYNYWELLKDFQPIPLTEDWLIMLGFEKLLPNIEDETKKELRTVIIFRKMPLTYNTSNGWWLFNQPLKIKIEHIHALQNLYFALTGTELTIQP